MNRSLSILLAASVLMFAPGCATFVTHSVPLRPGSPQVYRGTSYNANRVREAIAPQRKDEMYDDIELRILTFFFAPIDLPLSFVADTLLLPYDVLTMNDSENSQ